MEDSEDKLRRNAILISTLLIGAWWLDADLAGNTVKFFGIFEIRVDAQKLWPALLAILIYCALRFHFSEGRKEAYREFRADYDSYRKNVAGNFIEKRLLRDVYEKHLEQYRAEAPKLAEVSLSGNTYVRKGPPALQRSGTAGFPELGFTSWRRVYYQIGWLEDDADEFDRRYPHGPDSTDSMVFSKIDALRIHAQSLVHHVFYTRHTLELIFPYIACVAAFFICQDRVITT